MKKYFSLHAYTILILLILLFGSVLRFYNYTNRYGIAYDQAHDALVARSALHNHNIPLLGPFSSAGPFVMGPEWYYFIMLGTLIYPGSILSPWILLTTLYIFEIYLMILIGNEIKDKKFGLILGFITAVSYVQIAQAINLTNQAPLSILSATILWCILKFIKSKKNIYLLPASLAAGIGVNIHLQGVLLIPLILLTFLIVKPNFKSGIYSAVAFLLPFLPLIYFDFTHSHYESRNMLQYYLHDQYKIPLDQLGRNWKSYLFVFWPNALDEMIGGYRWISLILIVMGFLVFIYKAVQKQFSKFSIIFIISFLIAVIFLRYTHTPLFSSYLMFINPFIFIIFGWVIYTVLNFNLLLGLLILLLSVSGSLVRVIQDMQHSINITELQVKIWENALKTKYPSEKFALYDWNYKTTGKSLALSLSLDANNLIDNDGHRVGFAIMAGRFPYKNLPKLFKEEGYQIFDLQSSTSAQLTGKYGWSLVNPDKIYEQTEFWYK